MAFLEHTVFHAPAAIVPIVALDLSVRVRDWIDALPILFVKNGSKLDLFGEFEVWVMFLVVDGIGEMVWVLVWVPDEVVWFPSFDAWVVLLVVVLWPFPGNK